ncbi:hypothetical protein ACJMK2_018072 [Sinanodonta woodiana]|uniref:Endonuclease/exonuclease/phosphatase domain-containing protein n=1 Tax=Sinanodonta woodiana TaxID=1069815 RepID=A0ABD3UG80_SINWO
MSSDEVKLETNCELSWSKIQVQGSKPLYTGCFYRQPNNESTPLEQLNGSLSKLSHGQNLPNILLTGDFNAPDIQWDSNNTIRTPQQYNRDVNETLLNIVNEQS